MGRLSFVVSTLLAFALAATVLAGALLVGIFPTGPGGSAVATARPSGSLGPLPSGGVPSPTLPPPSVAPSATPAPTVPGDGSTYEVQPGDSLSLIGQRLGIPWQLIAEANNILPPDYVIVPGQVLTIPSLPEPSGGVEFYVVQSGDTITGIALQFGITPTALADYNNIDDWNSIEVGQILDIPTDSNATARPAPTP